ncbi:MAG TPA: hypothetical protein VFG25_01675 [Nitrosopumilaceae archaeon]|nr:hypothetical protein [Nitrosopumilaceae archaeon]
MLIVFAVIFLNPVYAQDQKNPSLIIHTEEVPYYDFNIVARDASPIPLENIHDISWQVTIDNNLLYGNPNGNAVLRFYDAEIEDKFIEIGMGSPPDHKFWIAVQLPEMGYVPVHTVTERGWAPNAKSIISYTDQAGLTVNNGLRIVVSNLDVDDFAISSYSVHGMESSTDPPATTSGSLKMEFLSGDPAQNPLHLFPFYVTAGVGIIAAILFLTKKRSS